MPVWQYNLVFVYELRGCEFTCYSSNFMLQWLSLLTNNLVIEILIKLKCLLYFLYIAGGITNKVWKLEVSVYFILGNPTLSPEAYLEPSRKSTMELSWKNSFIIDSNYASDLWCSKWKYHNSLYLPGEPLNHIIKNTSIYLFKAA